MSAVITDMTRYFEPHEPEDAFRALQSMPVEMQERVGDLVSRMAGATDEMTATVLGCTTEMANAVRHQCNPGAI
jgi:hypothetical protein